MANYNSLKATINADIKTNHEQEITGSILNSVLIGMVDNLAAGYLFKGVATPATNPGTPDQNVYYIAGAGTYTHFNNATIDDGEVGVFLYNGAWTVERVSLASTNFLNISTDVPDLSYNESEPQTIADQMGHSIADVLATGAVRFVGDVAVSYYKVIGYYGAEGGYITFIGVDNIYQYDVNASGYITDEKVTSIAPDDNLSDTSENAVQNKVVKAAFDAMNAAKQDVLTFDDVPTENSNNPVKSGGVKTALNELGQKVDEKISTFITYENLISQEDVISGFFVNQGSGEESTNPSYNGVSKLPIKPNTAYTLEFFVSGTLDITTSVYGIRFAFYNSSQVFISGTVNQTAVTSPNNAAYVSICWSPYGVTELAQLVEGDAIGVYKSGPVVRKECIEDPVNEIIEETVGAFNGGDLEALETQFLSLREELYNSESTQNILGYRYLATGALQEDAMYMISHPIKVTVGETLYFSRGTSGALDVAVAKFNKGNFLSQEYRGDGDYTVESGIDSIRITFYQAYRTTVHVTQGNRPEWFPPYGYKIPNTIFLPIDPVDVYLPDTIFVAKDTPIRLYSEQYLSCGCYDAHHIKWVTTSGQPFKRDLRITAGAVGTKAAYLTVVDNLFTEEYYKEISVVVKNNILSNAVKLLTIGDSLTNNKAWEPALINMSSNKIELVGTLGSDNVHHEGRSGWSAANYLAPTVYEGVTNPFWNPTAERFDWAYYKAQTGIDPDVVQIFLGTNGLELDPTTNANNIKQIVDYIRQDDADIPIMVVNAPYMANQDGIAVQTNSDGYSVYVGMYDYEQKKKVFNLAKRLKTIFSSYTSIYLVPICLTMDRDYSFGNVMTDVNEHCSFQVPMPIEAVHPQECGYLQMADTMFGVICGIYN